jgi:hypothetical protein
MMKQYVRRDLVYADVILRVTVTGIANGGSRVTFIFAGGSHITFLSYLSPLSVAEKVRSTDVAVLTFTKEGDGIGSILTREEFAQQFMEIAPDPGTLGTITKVEVNEEWKKRLASSTFTMVGF